MTRSAGPVPAELDTIIGRGEDLAKLKELVELKRLVTLVGPGGVGKTRLSVSAANQAREAQRYRDGVVVVELAEVADDNHDQLCSQLLMSLGLYDNSDHAPEIRLTEYLRDRELLLVLDNCEHVLGVLVPLLRILRREARGLHVLATSRGRLGLEREHLYEVRPLAWEPVDGQVTNAMQLLIERAAEVGVQVAHDDGEAARLCELMEGLPLAIELAASRLDMRSLAEINEALADPLELLGAVAHVEQVHHRSLHAAMEWSYRLLSPAERRMWAVLAEFRGSFSARLVREVCAGLDMDGDDVMTVLSGLLHRSILTRVEHPSGESHLKLLQPLRRYALGLRLEGADCPRDRIRRVHAEYFSDLARRAAAEWYGPEEVEWMRILTDAMPNLSCSVDYFLSCPAERQRGLQMAVDLCRTRVPMYGSFLATGRRMLASTLDQQPAGPSNVLQITALALEAWLAYCQGQSEAGAELLDPALVLAKELGGEPPHALLFALGTGMALNPDPAQWADSIDVLDRAVATAAEMGDHGDAARCMMFAGIAAAFHGDASAVTRSAELVDATERAGARWAYSWALWIQALAEHRHGDVNRATSALRRALQIQRELGDTSGLTWGVWLAAVLTASRGLHAEAAKLFGAAEALQRRAGGRTTGIDPFLRIELGARSAGLRELDDTELVVNTAAGQALQCDDAVDFALATLHQQEVVENPANLTDKEWEVTRWVARGFSNRDIAKALNLSIRTVEAHVSRILGKVGVPSRSALTAWVFETVGAHRLSDAASQ